MTVNREEARSYVGNIITEMLYTLRLNAWRIDIEWHAADGFENTQGRCTADPKYRRAIIIIDCDLHDDMQDIGNTLRHELLHIMHASFQTYRRACSQGLERTEDNIVDEVYQLAAEETVLAIESMLDQMGMSAEALAKSGRERRSAWAAGVVAEGADADADAPS